jgi:hypothetical protein
LTHSFESTLFQPLNLSGEKLVSKLPFEWVNLYRYDAAAAQDWVVTRETNLRDGREHMVGFTS